MNYIAARRTEEKERRRGEILDAAERVAAAAGIENLTMEQVARAARLSRGLLYIYFRDRADLQLGLCERGMAMLHERFVRASSIHPRGIDKLTAIGRAYVDFSEQCPVYFESLARFEARDASIGDQEGNLPACLMGGERLHQLMTQTLEAGILDGSIATTIGEPNTVAISLWALMHGAIQIARLKSGVLARHGVTAAGLVEQSLRMANIALARG
jgi:AcrR family transcriptional regulator